MTDLRDEFVCCLNTMSSTRAGWDYQLSPSQRAKENREEAVALARARTIWADYPEHHDVLRAAFAETGPLASMSEIERL